MGGSYAVTDSDAEDRFDFLSVKPGDVLWSAFWRRGRYQYDEPTMFSRTVKSLDMIEETRRQDSPPEQMWKMVFEENDDRYFYVNKRNASYQPFFWKSREECEADLRNSLAESISEIEEEMTELQKALDHAKTLVSEPIKYDPDFE